MQIQRATIAGVLRAALRCVCRDETRPHLNGVMLRGDGGRLIVASTDGHRIFEARVSVECAWEPVLLSPLNTELLRKALRPSKRAEWLTQVELTRTSDGLRMGESILAEAVPPKSANGADQTFPPYHKAMPDMAAVGSDGASAWAANPCYLLDAMQQVKDVFAGDSLPQARLSTPTNELHPVRIDAEGDAPVIKDGRGPHVGVTLIVMPCRLR